MTTLSSLPIYAYAAEKPSQVPMRRSRSASELHFSDDQEEGGERAPRSPPKIRDGCLRRAGRALAVRGTGALRGRSTERYF